VARLAPPAVLQPSTHNEDERLTDDDYHIQLTATYSARRPWIRAAPAMDHHEEAPQRRLKLCEAGHDQVRVWLAFN
jgi:hypothetical protein